MLDNFPALALVNVAQQPKSVSRDAFHHTLDEFPMLPAGLPFTVEFRPEDNDIGELKSWDRGDKSHLSDSAAFGGAWDHPIPSREVLFSPKSISAFNERTNNISIVNRNTANHHSGPIRTCFDNASITSPTLHSRRLTLPALPSEVKHEMRESTFDKVKVVAKKSAKRHDCFSSDDEGEVKGRQASTSTVSTIVSGIAEITDVVSMIR
jgi:hypothetical protein